MTSRRRLSAEGSTPPAAAWPAGLSSALVLAAALATGLAAATAKAAELKAGALTITQPWTRATPPGAAVAAAFLRITNTGGVPDRLVGGTATIAGAVEFHEMKMDGGIMRMRNLPGGLEIKPGETVELKPGGLHIMLVGLKGPVTPQSEVKGTLTFEKAGTVELTYKVEPIGARGPSGGQHGGHTQ